MPLPPYPSPPAPRTWTAGDFLTEQRLRGDQANAVLLLANKPVFAAQQTAAAQSIPSGTTTPINLDTELYDSWGGHQIPSSVYTAPFSGWYLCEGNWFMAPSTATRIQSCGLRVTQNGSSVSNDGVKITGNGSADGGATCVDLFQLITPTGDTVQLTGFQDSGSSQNIGTASFGAYMAAEWTGLPSNANGYSGSAVPLGTVVASPPVPAQWAPGAGTTISNAGGISAGAASVTVGSATGMITGGVLVLEPGALISEAVTITSVAGTVIGITAPAFSHAHGAPVGVTTGAPWLNSQVRDMVNFLCYPPMLRAQIGTGSPSLPSQTWPASTQIPIATVSGGVDNFGGFSTSAHTYTFPVSGNYDCYGQVYLAGSANNMSLGAGLQVSGGSVMWGDVFLNTVSDSAQFQSASVRRLLRVTAGQTLQLVGSQNSGATLALQNSGGKFSTMIAVFRGF